MHAKPVRPSVRPYSLPIWRQAGDADLCDAYLSLVLRRTQGLLLRILPAAEKAFAKRTTRTLEEDEVEDKLVNPGQDPAF